MSNSRPKQARVMSASVNSDKRLKLINSRVQAKSFGRTFTEANETENIFKTTKSQIYRSGGQHIFKTNERSFKVPEELMEENFQLRNQLNDVNSKLYMARSKMQSQKKKHLVYAKKLNRQFQNELYWQNEKQNNYLITGVKYQYDRLKQQYQKKCQEFQMLKKTMSMTDIDELSAYCLNLETENKILLENIAFLKRKKITSNYEDSTKQNPKFNINLQQIFYQQRKKQQRYKAKIKNFEEELAKLTQKQIDLSKKVKFLEKLIIEKQNEAHKNRRNLKTMQREKNKVINEIKSMEAKILERQKLYQNQIQEILNQNQKQAKIQQSMFQKLIKEKNNMIEKLQKEIGYLSTLLTHWKPIDELEKMDRNQMASSQKQRSISLHNQSIKLPSGPSRQLYNRPKTPMSSIFMEENHNEERFLLKTIHNQEFLSKDSFLLRIGKEELQIDESKVYLEPRKSIKKWSENAKKCRKVQVNEVQHLGDLIKYKMIANGISINEMKEYFSCKVLDQSHSKREEQLITMKELKQTFVSQPFVLAEQDAFLLSRYIIEDQGVEFVYCHEGNELQRPIVKSIIKTLVGEYSLPDRQKCEAKWIQIKKVYSKNLQMALKSISPKGLISKKKFIELVKSLGIQMQEQVKDYLIGRLISEQKSLDELKYNTLFSNEERID